MKKSAPSGILKATKQKEPQKEADVMKCIKRGAHMTFEDRKRIETVFNAYIKAPTPPSIRAIARELGLPESTLRRELRLGCVDGIYRMRLPDLKQKVQYFHYSAQRAQEEACRRAREKGPRGKLTMPTVMLFLTYLRIWRSIPAAWQKMRQEQPLIELTSLRNIYNHAAYGTFSTMVDGGFNCKSDYKKKKKHLAVRLAKNHLPKLTIADLPPEVREGNAPGFVQMDTVHSCQGSTAALLVMLFPKSHRPYVRRVSDLSRKSIHKAIRSITKEALADGYIMTHILTDNGNEFIDATTIQRITKAPVYYTHAYAGWEKGAVENLNRLIRRMYAKKTDFAKLKRKDILALQQWLTDYPRANKPKKGIAA